MRFSNYISTCLTFVFQREERRSEGRTWREDKRRRGEERDRLGEESYLLFWFYRYLYVYFEHSSEIKKVEIS